MLAAFGNAGAANEFGALDAPSQHSVPIEIWKSIRLQHVHAEALNRLIEREALSRLTIVVELGEDQLPVARVLKIFDNS